MYAKNKLYGPFEDRFFSFGKTGGEVWTAISMSKMSNYQF